ncbi:bifunctional enoyl-CoA hydratase/phosphate acetyltransferase [Aliikangiella maris]|uniref:Bifunctional enoyl-CoA hydratase/phosphate acetyltransferase n=2 Tax=Aliikangiella maris TaxID=3162458 RepID=A0ABV2BWF5_9GAMM
MTDLIENITFDEIKINDSAAVEHTLTNRDIQLFALVSGDVNPAHLDESFARNEMFHKIIAHGMWGGSLISTVLGTQLPGPGTIYLSQTFKFIKPVAIGDTVTAKVTVIEKNEEKKRLTLECTCLNQLGEKVIIGEAQVIAPTAKIKRKRVKLPIIEFKDEDKHDDHCILQLTKDQTLQPLKIGVVHPADGLSLIGVNEAKNAGLIEPVLIGPENKIRAAAESVDIDLSGFEIVSTPHSHAAAEQSVKMVKEGHLEALMRGKLQTEELMYEVMSKRRGLCTNRHMSHVMMLDLPNYPRPLFVTDGAINISPNLSQKVDIVQNAIDLYVKLGFGLPKVAILSAIETVNEEIPSTLDATALCKMAERGQITEAFLDGPLAFDNAISEESAAIKGIRSQVAGKADILVVPSLEAGNILFKQLALFSGAKMAGIVLGAEVPIVLTSLTSTAAARKASCALALLALRGETE